MYYDLLLLLLWAKTIKTREQAIISGHETGKKHDYYETGKKQDMIRKKEQDKKQKRTR